jgi:CheY-like chemotaxis protein
LLSRDQGEGVMAGNILVVDDDRLIRELISKTLRKDGHRVVEACDGALALEILEVLQFDLVITGLCYA